MLKSVACSLIFILLPLSAFTAEATEPEKPRRLLATPVSQPPIIDGNGDDAAWGQAQSIQVRDAMANIPLSLTAIYTAQRLFIRVVFPDNEPNLRQKTYAWDATTGRYRTSTEREDTFLFKWAMEADVTDLTISADQSYKADVWYWKAARTDPVGYADDKLNIYSRGRLPQSKQVLSRTGQSFYLRRSGDAGQAAYQVLAHPEYQADSMPKYALSTPTGSRADIRAKGLWRDGVWTLEFTRALQTGQPDDIQFDTEQRYLFGVSRYEIAGRKPNPALQQPLFGAGEIGEHLQLVFLPAR